MNYYNEFDPSAAQWLRNLIVAGLIPEGDVDTRSITEVKPDEIRHYTQCHFFAGIGGWSYALQLAGWPTDRPVWTGSCPCQPFSTAGNQKGKNDERHLWPVWFELIKQCRPATIFGEQVESAIAHGWLDDVYQGLEAEGYACGAAVLPACSVGAPHKRNRLFFVGHAKHDGSFGGTQLCGNETTSHERGQERKDILRQPSGAGVPLNVSSVQGCDDREWKNSCDVANAECKQAHQEQPRPSENERGRGSNVFSGCGVDCIESNVADTKRLRQSRQGQLSQPLHTAAHNQGQTNRSNNAGAGLWERGAWVDCPDGKQRLIEPSIPLLAHGVPARVAQLRGFGNAIVPQVAAEFIRSNIT
jgi:DNA (cytosine-5)-methyltransferase 1